MNYERIELMLGSEALAKLQNSCVLVVGVGGVGSFSAESLARSGVGKLILVDGDTIDSSNMNRQIMAIEETVGNVKAEEMKKRIHSYNKDCEVEVIQTFYDHTVNELIFHDKIDFVIDAIDTITSKMDLIEACIERNIPFISSTGMANRLDPSLIEVMDLSKTTYDPLAKVMRRLAKERRIKGKIPVVCSREQPMVQTKIVNEDGLTRKQKMPPASMIFVPASAGLLCASYALSKLIEG